MRKNTICQWLKKSLNCFINITWYPETWVTHLKPSFMLNFQYPYFLNDMIEHRKKKRKFKCRYLNQSRLKRNQKIWYLKLGQITIVMYIDMNNIWYEQCIRNNQRLKKNSQNYIKCFVLILSRTNSLTNYDQQWTFFSVQQDVKFHISYASTSVLKVDKGDKN